MKDQTVWIKEEDFTIRKLLDYENASADIKKSIDVLVSKPATLAQWRLVPQDYHNIHSPVAGEVVGVHEVAGPLLSVASDAITSGNGCIYNQRVYLVINTNVPNGSRIGTVCLVGVGATVVGSVKFLKAPGGSASEHEATRHDESVWRPLRKGDSLRRGEYCGRFAFGGSTVVGLFENGKVEVDPAYLEPSRLPVETLVRTRGYFGKAKQ